MSGRESSKPMRTIAREHSPLPAVSSPRARAHYFQLPTQHPKEGLMTTLRTAGRTEIG